MQTLEKIVGEFDPESGLSGPKRERLWTKVRMTTKLKQVESFRKGLSEVKSTLMLGLMFQKYASGSQSYSRPTASRMSSALTVHVQHPKAATLLHEPRCPYCPVLRSRDHRCQKPAKKSCPYQDFVWLRCLLLTKPT